MNPRTKRRLILSTAVVGSLAAIVAGGLAARGWYRAEQLAAKRAEGLALFAQGRHAAALEPLAFAARDNSDTDVVLALAESRMKVPEANARHLTTAAAYFRSVHAREQRNERAMRGLLEAYVAMGHLPEIQPVLRRLLEVAPRDVRAHEIELEVLNLTGRFADAARKARELQQLEPANSRWRAAELVCLERSGADAEGRLARVREWRGERDGQSDAALDLLESDLLRESGQAEDSRAILRRLAEAGMTDRRQLEALIAALESANFESAERDQLVARTIERSRGALSRATDASEIEGERLLRAGRLDEILTRFADAPADDPAVFRLRFAAMYLSGRMDEAAAFARAHGGTRDAFAAAAAAASGDEPARVRIEAIAGPQRVCPKDPVVAILLSDIMLDAGEFDEAQSILVRAFEESGDSFQPLGVRAVRASVALGRVRDAFRIAEELLVRYGPSGDAGVALLAVEAWAAVLEANYQPPTRGGVYGTNSPEALRRFWAALAGPDAVHGPASLAPVVADVFLARGDRQTARAILEGALDADATALGGLGSGKFSRALKAASSIDPSLQGALLGSVDAQLGSGREGAELALVVAERLAAQDDPTAAIRVLDRAIAATEPGPERTALERARRPLAEPEGLEQWLAAELARDPGLEAAIFVLSRPEPWASADDALVSQAITLMREALGADSLRVLVAEAAMHMAFHAEDRSRLAMSIAALDAAAMRSPDSASVLTTLAALFERQTPPQYERSSRLLARAIEAEPGAVSTYPQLVNALQQIGDFEGAEEALEAYIAVVGEDLQTKRSVADFKVRQGRLAEAAQIREQLVGRSKEVVDAIALARIRQRLGDVAAAEQILAAMRTELSAPLANGRDAAAPSGASAPSGAITPRGDLAAQALLIEREMALLFARDGRMAEARTSLERAGGESGVVRFDRDRLDEVRANVELAYGDLDSALRIAEDLVRRKSTGSHELLLARALLRTGDKARAREALTRSLVADPDNTDATTVAAALLVGDPGSRAMLERSLAAASVARPDLAAAIALLDGVTTPDGRVAPDEAALARAVALTAEYSGSPLVWRVAAHLHILADRRDDAHRIAQRALSRLPSDSAIGKLATETAIAAGRVDDAASAALAWRKMATAESFEVDVARATIELLQRRPQRGYELLKPIARDILTRSGDAGPARVLVACAVQAGTWRELEPELASLSAVRRGEALGAWLEAAQGLGYDSAVPAVEAVERNVGDRSTEGGTIATAACIAAWTALCREGVADACDRAQRLLDGFDSPLVPKAILVADLASARGASAEAAVQYRAIYGPVLVAAGVSADANLPAVAADAERNARLIEALRRTPVAIVALTNAADNALRARSGTADAVALAAIAVAAIPNAPEAIDTLVRALVAERRLAEATTRAASNPDGVLAAIALAEIEVSRNAPSEARRALARLESRVQSTFAPPRALGERIERLRQAVGRMEVEASAGERVEAQEVGSTSDQGSGT